MGVVLKGRNQVGGVLDLVEARIKRRYIKLRRLALIYRLYRQEPSIFAL
jgi:hypothetical protein